MRLHPALFLLSAAVSAAITTAAAQAQAPSAHPAPAKAAQAAAKTYPVQAAVAAKTKFATVSAKDKAAAGALNAKALPQALKRVGKPGAFQGTVTNVHIGKGNSIVILNFAANYKDALTAVVKPAEYAKFPALTQLQGKHVLIHGVFIAYHGATEVDLTAPSQIKIIQ